MKYLIIISLALLLITGCSTPPEVECINDSDCIPAQCCHSAECTASYNAPNCSGIYCTQECVPDTLDCQQGSCICDNGICSTKFVTK